MQNDITVTFQEEDTFSICTTSVNASYIESIGDINDVDLNTNGKVDGSVLVYDASTGKWVSTIILEKQLMNAGHF